MKKCDKGFDGKCCCNCANQIRLYNHCTFKIKQNEKTKGCSCSKPLKIDGKDVYACLGFHNSGEGARVNVMSKHGVCEMHINKS